MNFTIATRTQSPTKQKMILRTQLKAVQREAVSNGAEEGTGLEAGAWEESGNDGGAAFMCDQPHTPHFGGSPKKVLIVLQFPQGSFKSDTARV